MADPAIRPLGMAVYARLCAWTSPNDRRLFLDPATGEPSSDSSACGRSQLVDHQIVAKSSLPG